MCERADEIILRDVQVRDGLSLNRLDVHLQRHRGLADVLAPRERFLRFLRAAIDDHELVVRRREAGAATDLDEALGLEELHHALGDVLHGKAERARDLGHRHLAAEVERFQREVGKEPEREAGLLKRLRLRREWNFGGCRLPGIRGRRRPDLRRRLVHVAPFPSRELGQHTFEGLFVYDPDTDFVGLFEL